MPKINDKVLSIIIVNHNTKILLISLLDSLKRAIDYLQQKTEVIVVDNSSTDTSVATVKKKYPWVYLIKNKVNTGYAYANNQAIRQAQGKYILLLNSDTKVSRETLKIMIDYMEKNKQVGVATCKVVLPNQQIDPACHRGFPTPWASLSYFLGLEKLFPQSPFFSKYHLYYKDLDSIHEIDSPSGAFYLTKKEIFKKVGLLDEAFFMYGEDLDLSYRIKQANWKIIYNPQAQILHYKKRSGLNSSSLETRKKTIQAFYSAMEIFYQKHYRHRYPFILRLIVMLIIKLKKQIALLGIES